MVLTPQCDSSLTTHLATSTSHHQPDSMDTLCNAARQAHNTSSTLRRTEGHPKFTNTRLSGFGRCDFTLGSASMSSNSASACCSTSTGVSLQPSFAIMHACRSLWQSESAVVMRAMLSCQSCMLRGHGGPGTQPAPPAPYRDVPRHAGEHLSVIQMRDTMLGGPSGAARLWSAARCWGVHRAMHQVHTQAARARTLVGFVACDLSTIRPRPCMPQPGASGYRQRD